MTLNLPNNLISHNEEKLVEVQGVRITNFVISSMMSE